MLNKKWTTANMKAMSKDHYDESRQQSKMSTDKVKYKYKNHWIDEELVEVVPYRMKKKRVG